MNTRPPSRFLALCCCSLLFLASWAAHAQENGLGRHKQIYAVPAPGKVVIDGKLDDWDLSGQIEMYVAEEIRETQSAKFALMYDSEALYISGVVRDTTPMMNRHDPQVSGNRGWDADSCQFRLTVDPAQPYPVEENVFQYRGKQAKADSRDDIKHLTLWYYTDRNEPCLAMQMGMSYRAPRAEWAPFGVVKPDQFQAKYVKAEDGRGYTFEYRIPWTTLGAKAPLKGGNIVAGTVQFNWGAADGLKTNGGSAWAYDLLRGPGFAFQNADCWGKIIFAEKGNVSKELVEAGIPQAKPEPLKFTYELPEDGQITLQLFDQENLVRRILVAQGDRTKGKHTESWDGMDDQGKPLPPGVYTLKGIIHKPITSKFLFSVHNSGQPPYPTDDNKGGWGGDHGNPTACSALPDGMLLSWEAAEYGWGIIKVDLEGRKQWGIKTQALFMANDGKRLFVYDPNGIQSVDGVQLLDTADGRPLNFGNGKPVLAAPPGGDKERNRVTGLAYANGHVFVSYAKRNLIGVFDAASGALIATWDVPEPGVIAGRPDGTLVGISAGKPVAVAGGKVAPLAGAAPGDIEMPSGISVAADGTIYVSNQGKLQDIAVLDATGKLLRRIGKAGGRPAVGKYDPSGLYEPGGLALDARGRLWVAEHADSPKRVSVWNAATGAFEKEYFGGCSYFAYAFINPAVPDEIYCHNVLWRVDWEKNTTTPISTIWRKTAPDMIPEYLPDGGHGMFHSITAANGRQYAIGGAPGMYVVSRRVGNEFKPFMAAFSVNRSWSLSREIGIPAIDALGNGSYFWQDVNDDGCVQPGEIYKFKDPNFQLRLAALGPDLTVWALNGQQLKPVKWLDNGQPVYDPEKIEKTFLSRMPAPNYLWLDPDGSIYTLASGRRPSLARWSAGGKMEWGYPSIPAWRQSLALPIVKAGRLHGLTAGLGVAGNFTGNMSYFGVCHLFQRDGIYAAAIMKDGRTGGLGPETGQPEGQGGALVSVVTRPGAAPRILLLGAGQDGRVTEVLGLDTVKPLPERKFVLEEKDARLASDALAEFLPKSGAANHLALYPGRDSLKTSAPASKTLDGTREFSACAAYDKENLYVSFEVTSPSDLVNASTDPRLVFKGGNCLDIQLATDPSADPQRKTPAPGDIRLLVTRHLGPDGKTLKPYAVLFRPKVNGFTGEPIVLTSPTGQESFDEITVVETVTLDYRKTPNGFAAVVTIPLKLIGFALKAGDSVKMDLGYIYGNATGNQVAARSYLKNRSFSANVVNDVPNESRLEPKEWDDVVAK